MEIPSLNFSLPCHHQIHETLHTEWHTRITFIAIGTFGILSGIFVTSPIGGFDSLKLVRGIVLLCLGTTFTVYCFKEKRDLPILKPVLPPILSPDIPQQDLNELQKKLLLIFEAICKDELYQQHKDSEHITKCKNYIINLEKQIEENSASYLEVANCFQGYLAQIPNSKIFESHTETQKILEEVYSDLGRIFIARREIFAFEFETSEPLLCAVIKKFISIDYLYVHGILASFPEDYREKWRHWEFHEALVEKYLNLNSYRSASIVVGWMPECSLQARLNHKIEEKKLELSGKNPSLVSPFKRAPSSGPPRTGSPRKLFA